jgi:transcriptional regulator GlxA family with amidase domain
MRKWQITAPGPEDVAVLLFPRFSMHCLANVVEPMRAANDIAGRRLYRWQFVTLDGAPVVSSSGLPVVPEARLAAHPGGAMLLVHSSYGFREHAGPGALRALRGAAGRFDRMLGLDTGGWLMAAAGLLDGRRATLHAEELTAFAEAFPEVEAVAERFVDAGDMLTSGGATAAFDLVLELIGRSHGEALKLEVAALFLHVGYAAPARASGPRGPDVVDRAVALMAAHLEEPLPIPALARLVGTPPRALGRAFQARLGAPPQRVYKRLRLAEARRLAEGARHSVAEIALRCGYRDAAAMTRAFVQEYGRPPTAFRRPG